MSVLYDRLDYLFRALQRSSTNGYFTIYERMLIHQERGAIYQAIEEISEENDNPKPKFQIKGDLEDKIEFLMQR